MAADFNLDAFVDSVAATPTAPTAQPSQASQPDQSGTFDLNALVDSVSSNQTSQDQKVAAGGMADVLSPSVDVTPPWLQAAGKIGMDAVKNVPAIKPFVTGQAVDDAKSMVSGAASMVSGAAALPAMGYEIATGKDAPQAWLKNPVVKFMDNAAQATSVKGERYANESLSSLMQQGRVSDASNYLELSVMENMPQVLGTTLAALAGAPEAAALGAMAALSAGQRFQENKKRNEDLVSQGKDPMKKFNYLLDAAANGSLEAIGEVYFGSFTLAKMGLKLISEIGVVPAKEAMKKAFQLAAQDIFTNASEETWTQFSQDAVARWLGTADTPTGKYTLGEMVSRALESGIIGGILGGGVAGLTMSHQLKGAKKQADTVLRMAGHDISKMTQQEKDAIIEKGLPPEILAKYRTVTMRIKDVDKQRLSRWRREKLKVPKGETADPQFEDAKTENDPSVYKFQDAKAQMEAELVNKMPTEEFIAKRDIIKDKTGLHIGQMPSTLRNTLLVKSINELQEAPVEGEGSIAASIKSEVHFVAGEKETDMKFVAVISRTEDSKVTYIPKVFSQKQGKGIAVKGAIDVWIEALSNNDLTRDYVVVDHNQDRADALTEIINEKLKEHRDMLKRQGAITPAPSEVIAQVLNEKQDIQTIIDTQVQSLAEQQKVPDFADTKQAIAYGDSIAGNQKMVDLLKMKRERIIHEAKEMKGKENRQARLDMAVKAQFIREAVEAAEGVGSASAVMDQASADLHQSAAVKLFNPVQDKPENPVTVERVNVGDASHSVADPGTPARTAFGTWLNSKKIGKDKYSAMSAVAQEKLFQQFKKENPDKPDTALDALKKKLNHTKKVVEQSFGANAAANIADLAVGKTPEEVHTKTRADFWKNYESVKSYISHAFDTYGNSIQLTKKKMLTVTHAQAVGDHLNAGKSGRVAVGAVVHRGSTLVNSEIQYDEAKLRDDYRRLRKGETVESDDIEQLSPDTFLDFKDGEDAYIQYAILHEKTHLLAGLDGEVNDENLVKLLALELLQEKARKAEMATPRLDVEIQRMSDVMSGKRPGHVPGFPWTVNLSKNYDVTYLEHAGKTSEVHRITTGMTGKKLIQLRDSGKVRIVEVTEPRIRDAGVNTNEEDLRVGQMQSKVEQAMNLNRIKVELGVTDNFNPDDEIALQVRQQFSDIQSEQKDVEDMATQAWQQSEEGRAALKSYGPELSDMIHREHELVLWSNLMALLELHQQRVELLKGTNSDPELAFNEHPQVKALVQWLKSEAGIDALSKASDGLLSSAQLMSTLPTDLQKMMEAHLKGQSKDRQTRALGFPTPTGPRKESSSAVTRLGSANRIAHNTITNTVTAPFGWFHSIFGKKSSAIKALMKESMGQTLGDIFNGMHPNLQTTHVHKVINAWNDVLRRAKLNYTGLEDENKMVAYSAGADIYAQVIKSVMVNTPELVKKDDRGNVHIEEAHLLKRLELVWKSTEEFRVPSAYADKTPWKVVKTLQGKGLLPASQAFLDANKEVLAGSTNRPEMFYWSQLTKEEQLAAVEMNAWVARQRDIMLANGHFENTDMIGNMENGYFIAKWQKREHEQTVGGRSGSGKKNTSVSSDKMKMSTDADDFLHRAKQENFLYLNSAATAISAYIHDNMRSLVNAKLATDMMSLRNPLVTEPVGAVTYASSVEKMLENQLKFTKSIDSNGKTIWNRPASADKERYPNAQYTTHGFMSDVLEYGAFAGWPALERKNGELPWMPKRMLSEFDWIFSSEYTQMGDVMKFFTAANFTSKMMVMYSPMFQLMQMTSSLLTGLVSLGPTQALLTPFKMFKTMVDIVRNDPMSAINPIENQRSKRGPFDTVIPQKGYENTYDLVRDAVKYGVPVVMPGAMLDELASYKEALPFENQDKSVYGSMLHFISPFSDFLWGTWIRNMSLKMWVESTAKWNKKLGPGLEFKAKELAAAETRQIMNATGRAIYGKEKQMLDILTFARDFSVVMARSITGALGMSGATLANAAGDNAIGTAIRRTTKSLFWGELTKVERRAMQPAAIGRFVTGSMLGALLINVLSLAGSALFSKDKKPRFAIENEAGKRDKIFIGYDERGSKLYMSTPFFQEFTTIWQFLPPELSFGVGIGPRQAATNRISTGVRLFAALITNAAPDGSGKLFIPAGQATTQDWFDSAYTLLSMTLPDYARANRDPNKSAEEYLSAFLFGSPITRGKRGSDVGGYVAGVDPNPGRLKYVMDMNEYWKIAPMVRRQLESEKKDLVRIPDAELEKAMRRFVENYPLQAASTITSTMTERNAPEVANVNRVMEFAIQNPKYAGKIMKQQPETVLEFFRNRDKKIPTVSPVELSKFFKQRAIDFIMSEEDRKQKGR